MCRREGEGDYKSQGTNTRKGSDTVDNAVNLSGPASRLRGEEKGAGGGGPLSRRSRKFYYCQGLFVLCVSFSLRRNFVCSGLIVDQPAGQRCARVLSLFFCLDPARYVWNAMR